jgi:DNA replication protein DnaC
MKEKAEKENLTPWEDKFKGPKKCQICGNDFEFITDNPYHTTYLCGDECAKKYYSFSKRCRECNKEFTVDRRTSNYDEVGFCSDICKQEQESRIYKEYIEKEVNKLPLKYRALNTDKTELLKACIDKSLFIWGKPGTGKSVFMASLVKEYIKLRKPAKWFSFPGLIMDLRNSFKKTDVDSPYDYAKEIALYNGVLCLDDLGAEKLTDFVREIMYYIINEREERILPTVITSNFSLGEIDEYIANRISSRIAGMCEILQFTGKDRRITK